MIDCSKCSSENTKLDPESLEITCNDCGEKYALKGVEKLKIHIDKLISENKDFWKKTTDYFSKLDKYLHDISTKNDETNKSATKTNKLLTKTNKVLVKISSDFRKYIKSRKTTKSQKFIAFLVFAIPVIVSIVLALLPLTSTPPPSNSTGSIEITPSPTPPFSPEPTPTEPPILEPDYQQPSLNIPDDPYGYALAIWNARHDMNELISLVNDSNRPLTPLAMEYLIIQGNININYTLINTNNTQSLTSSHIRYLITYTNLPLLTGDGINIGTTNTLRNLVYKMNNIELTATDMYAIAIRANSNEISDEGMHGEGITLLMLQSRRISPDSFILVVSANHHAAIHCPLAQRFVLDALNRAFENVKWVSSGEDMERLEFILEYMVLNYLIVGHY